MACYGSVNTAFTPTDLVWPGWRAERPSHLLRVTGFFTLIKELNMNKKLLCAALLGVGGLCVAQAASAQEFDDRWYVTGSVGYNWQDNDRNTEDTPFATIGFGRFI